MIPVHPEAPLAARTFTLPTKAEIRFSEIRMIEWSRWGLICANCKVMLK